MTLDEANVYKIRIMNELFKDLEEVEKIEEYPDTATNSTTRMLAMFTKATLIQTILIVSQGSFEGMEETEGGLNDSKKFERNT